LASAGRQTIEHHYSFAVRMHKMCAVYDALLDRSALSGVTRRDPLPILLQEVVA
jgi:hypothetical protein